MHITAVFNQKGGVGKTTTVQNFGAVLASNYGRRVLLVDLDAQGNLTDACGLQPLSLERMIYDVLTGACSFDDAVQHVEDAGNGGTVDILPANVRLAEAEINLVSAYGRESLLKDVLEPLADRYDYVLIDCPPSLGLLCVNALVAADGVLVPVQTEYFAMAGLTLVRRTVEQIQKKLNRHLRIDGVLLTLFDRRKSLHFDVASALAEDTWGKHLIAARIGTSTKLAEAPSAGVSILAHDARGKGAQDYAAAVSCWLQTVSREGA